MENDIPQGRPLHDKDAVMMTDQKSTVTLFVDRTNGQWVVRDTQGQFWVVPSGPNAWQQRQSFEPDEDTTLEVIPGHYKSMLGIPA